MDNPYTPKQYLNSEKQNKTDISSVLNYLNDLDVKGYRVVKKPSFFQRWLLPCFMIFVFLFCIFIYSEVVGIKRQVSATDKTFTNFVNLVLQNAKH